MTRKQRKQKKEFKRLVGTFGQALVQKLMANEAKYKFGDGWKAKDWEAQLQRGLAQHTLKGDPRDTAIYSLFAWYHGWRTAPLVEPTDKRFIQFPEANDVLKAAKGTEEYVSDLPIWRSQDSQGMPVVIGCLQLDRRPGTG